MGLTVSGGRATTLPITRDDALQAQAGQRLEGGAAGVADELHDPGAVVALQECPHRGSLAGNCQQVSLRPGGVAQVDEKQTAVVAFGRHPPGQAYLCADVGAGAASRIGRPGTGSGRRVRRSGSASCMSGRGYLCHAALLPLRAGAGRAALTFRATGSYLEAASPSSPSDG